MVSKWFWRQNDSWFLYNKYIDSKITIWPTKDISLIYSCLKTIFLCIIRQILMKLEWKDPWPEVLSRCSGIFNQRSYFKQPTTIKLTTGMYM